MKSAREWAEALHGFRPGMHGDQDVEAFLDAFAGIIAMIQEDAGADHDECQRGKRRAVEATKL